MSENHIEYTEDDLRERIDVLESEISELRGELNDYKFQTKHAVSIWKAKAERYEKALQKITHYGINSKYGEECCPYGCDTPAIAKSALAQGETERSIADMEQDAGRKD